MSFIKEYEFTAYLNEDGTGLDFEKPNYVARILRKFKDTRLLVKIKKLQNLRSDRQNRWLWGVAYVRIAAWHLHTQGERLSSEEIHAYVCEKVLGLQWTQKTVLGEVILVLKGTRTSKFSTKEFMDAKDKIQAFFAPMGCDIPDPREYNFLTDFVDG